MSRDQPEMDENTFWVTIWSRAALVIVVIVAAIAYTQNTTEAKCESACGVFSVDHVTARECVCSERRK